MALPEGYSRSAPMRERLWKPVRGVWAWLAPQEARSLPLRTYLVLAVIVGALHLPGQFSIPAMDRDEARYAEATRQMMLSGDFLDIRFGDQPRYVQPAGIYWLQAISTMPFGGPDAPIWAFRIPSMLSALASVLLLAWFGTRVASPAAGVGGALLLGASLLLTAEAHFAKIDSTLLLSILLAQVALFLSIENKEAKPRFVGWPLVFWAALAAGLLLKGPIILAVSFLTLIVYAVWNREPGLFLRLRPLLGVPVTILLVLPWLVAITVKTNGEFLSVALGQSIGGKLAGTSDEHGFWGPYHIFLLALTFFPGAVLVGLGAVHAVRHRRERLVRFLIAWILPAWLMFEIVPTKLPHYVLPLFPALALLAAMAVQRGRADLSGAAARWVHRVSGALFLVAGSALLALPFVAARRFEVPAGAPEIVAALAIAGVILAGASLWLRPSGARLLPLVLSMALAYFAMLQLVVPSLDPLWSSARIAQALKRFSGCGPIEVATAGYAEPSNLFHFGPKTHLGTGETAAEYLAAHQACGVAIVESAQRHAFDGAAAAKGLSLTSFGQIEGFNYVKGKPIRLEVLVPAGTSLHPAR